MGLETFGIAAAVVFFVIFVALAMIVFSLIKRTVKLALRLAIVGIILLVAVAGASSLWWFGGAKQPDTSRPATLRPNR